MNEAKLNKAKYIQGEIKSYNYLIKCIEDCNLNLERISTEIQGVSSPAFKDVILENKSNPYHDRKLELMEEETKYINERNDYIKRVKYVDKYLLKLNSNDYNMIFDLWIKRNRVDDVADKYHYSIKGMYKKITSSIIEII